MHRLWAVKCLVSMVLAVQADQPGYSSTLATPHQLVNDSSRPRSLAIEARQDITSYQQGGGGGGYQPGGGGGSYQPGGGGGYYPPPYPYPPPSYGPPTNPPEMPSGSVQIEFAFDEIVLRCITEEPFEHIVWVKYQCPQQFLFGGEGMHIADGSTVYQENLYDVHIRGHDGTIISELLIKEPLSDSSEGIYQCEVWPHIHGGGSYYPFGYQTYNAPKSEVFIIGGNSLLENCYRVGNFGPQLQPIKAEGIDDKQGSSSVKDPATKQNFSMLKPRRNSTESRKGSNSKQLRYNLKYVDNTLYNVDGVNVTADYFQPSKSNPFDLTSIYNNFSKSNSPKSLNNLSSFFDLTSRSNDKYRDIFPKLNIRKGRISETPVNSSIAKTNNKI